MVCCKKQNKLNDNYLDKIHSHIDLKQLELLERQFILDCIAVRKICDDYSKANPKHGSIIPPYNGQLDPYAKSYFESLNIQKLLEKNGQTPPGTSIEGEIADRFIINGAPTDYIRRRNKNGCGHSKEIWGGH
ncbi:unnamed protein product [Schistosoma mattheei]|uniref:Uncharacterized protein n=1 Tax=Schistosoma mattheei TaxID=31246 RepID=A0AA85BMZ5_9TREM|nr:unnamed protein product [Schistosoma mattheei]